MFKFIVAVLMGVACPLAVWRFGTLSRRLDAQHYGAAQRKRPPYKRNYIDTYVGPVLILHTIWSLSLLGAALDACMTKNYTSLDDLVPPINPYKLLKDNYPVILTIRGCVSGLLSYVIMRIIYFYSFKQQQIATLKQALGTTPDRLKVVREVLQQERKLLHESRQALYGERAQRREEKEQLDEAWEQLHKDRAQLQKDQARSVEEEAKLSGGRRWSQGGRIRKDRDSMAENLRRQIRATVDLKNHRDALQEQCDQWRAWYDGRIQSASQFVQKKASYRDKIRHLEATNAKSQEDLIRITSELNEMRSQCTIDLARWKVPRSQQQDRQGYGVKQIAAPPPSSDPASVHERQPALLSGVTSTLWNYVRYLEAKLDANDGVALPREFEVLEDAVCSLHEATVVVNERDKAFQASGVIAPSEESDEDTWSVVGED
ncbi:uncharacterized protein AB675_10471 [Cyphellophora attinorum]|uniref:Uncharacterized protein n=1 Tax=Cyphellophora attinorum TaxID=1664694 RepID=A0A0N0NIV2_9EURO|nr:uncharacterized protein AB675_10471 [Phialophora attinorum]KPI35879.1 hypothetical protein AB675_10471 [Phialophora attinorum]